MTAKIRQKLHNKLYNSVEMFLKNTFWPIS
nr:MAG TPA: hypothetical protein [Caudoviricetes sp.]